ncbi:MAG: alpha-xylosidase [Propionibacteriaceae bacterium]|jgi:alpha-D-xyloside xylohydrolase|nr:alpha-xylosidase [Propionibacteriaceae bacterium]
MKFTHGYWMLREGVTALHPVEVASVGADADGLTVYAATAPVAGRGDTVNRALLTLRLTSPAEGVIHVEADHWTGMPRRGPAFDIAVDPGWVPAVRVDGDAAVLDAGQLTAHVPAGGPFSLEFRSGGRTVTASGPKALAFLTVAGDGDYVREQLALGVGERVYGLGERFGPLAKNGQAVDLWNEDGGTVSEQAYKNVPFYLTSGGYGVFVDHPEKVSFEIASENVERVQFSVPGQRLSYYVIAGPTPKDVLRRYTGLTGRPPQVPAWSYGPWLSTSFTTNYDEATVTAAIDRMAELGLPLSVFHFDCFWMRPYEWCGFEWDPVVFPDPQGLIDRLHAKGVRVCVWVNPYIGQKAAAFAEAAEAGYLLRRTDGGVWQTDLWQPGMGIVDFTNPDARAWYAHKIEGLLDVGVDAVKTDFGERIPARDVGYYDGSDPVTMHNYYSFLYNATVTRVLRQRQGVGEAVVFARAATAGGQQFPVHWGGDSYSTFPSMAETLRGGLSLGLSGFAYWSHDIGGFEGTPPTDVYLRWTAFGLLSSHSRFHGSTSSRAPWVFGEEAVGVARRFSRLKLRLMPYLGQAGRAATDEGTPILRAMVLEFPGDRGAWDVDTQYMFGPSLLVAPVFSADGEVHVYIPEGRWTSLLDGTTVAGPRWVCQRHALDSLPLLVRPDTVLPLGAQDDRPDYDWADGVELACFELADGHDSTVVIPAADAGVGARDVTFRVRRVGSDVAVTTDSDRAWSLTVGGVKHSFPPGTTSASIPGTPGGWAGVT